MKIFKFLALPLVALLAFSCSDNNNGEDPPPVTETLNVEHQPLTYTWDSEAEITVSVKTNSEEDFTAVPDKDWIKVTAIDQENKTFKVSVTEYTEEDADPRTGEITVSVGKATPKKITVTQTSKNKTIPVDYTIKVTPEAKLAFDADKDLVKTLTVVCVNEVAVDVDDEYKDWLEAKLEGETLTVTVKENQEWEPATGRKGEIVLSAENTTDVKVEITQKAAEEPAPVYTDVTGTWWLSANMWFPQFSTFHEILTEVTLEYKSYELPAAGFGGQPVNVGPCIVLSGLNFNDETFDIYPEFDWQIPFETNAQKTTLVYNSGVKTTRQVSGYFETYIGGIDDDDEIFYPWDYNRAPGMVRFESSFEFTITPDFTVAYQALELNDVTYSASDYFSGDPISLSTINPTAQPVICYYDQATSLYGAGSIWVALSDFALYRTKP